MRYRPFLLFLAAFLALPALGVPDGSLEEQIARLDALYYARLPRVGSLGDCADQLLLDLPQGYRNKDVIQGAASWFQKAAANAYVAQLNQVLGRVEAGSLEGLRFTSVVERTPGFAVRVEGSLGGKPLRTKAVALIYREDTKKHGHVSFEEHLAALRHLEGTGFGLRLLAAETFMEIPERIAVFEYPEGDWESAESLLDNSRRAIPARAVGEIRQIAALEHPGMVLEPRYYINAEGQVKSFYPHLLARGPHLASARARIERRAGSVIRRIEAVNIDLVLRQSKPLLTLEEIDSLITGLEQKSAFLLQKMSDRLGFPYFSGELIKLREKASLNDMSAHSLIRIQWDLTSWLAGHAIDYLRSLRVKAANLDGGIAALGTEQRELISSELEETRTEGVPRRFGWHSEESIAGLYEATWLSVGEFLVARPNAVRVSEHLEVWRGFFDDLIAVFSRTGVPYPKNLGRLFDVRCEVNSRRADGGDPLFE